MDNKLDVRVYPIDEPKGNTKAFASIAVDDLIAIRGIRVIEGEKGLFVSMPQSFNTKTETYSDTAFPLTAELRTEISDAVLDEYGVVLQLDPEHRGYEKSDMAATGEINVADLKLDVRVTPLDDPKGNTKAFASVSVEDKIAIRSIRVVEDEYSTSVVMPQSKDGNKSRDVACPINGDLRKEIKRLILDDYKEQVAEKSASKSLANGLRKGAEKAAEHTAPPKEAFAAKKAPGIGD
jgi:stage V sporulation protein G